MRYLLVLAAALLFAQSVLAATDDRGVTLFPKNRDGRKRIALVIGNSTYLSSPLKNPANDAHTMAATLRRLGFDVDEKTDLGYIAMNEAVETFGNQLRSGGVGLFYYAGHGMQVGGNNYLIPVDARINAESEVRYKALDAGLILSKMDQAKSDVNIMVLDACRDNPFSRSFRSTTHGLASMDAPNGTFIAYATAPGKTAADGDGNNGLYTQVLVKILETPGLKLEDVFKRTSKGVKDKSGNQQTPWVASNLDGDFWFVPPSSMTDLQSSEVRPAPVSPPVVQQPPSLVKDQDAPPDRIGIKVSELTPDRAQQLQMKGEKGVVVTEVQPKGLGDRAGFHEGDLITEVNGTRIAHSADYSNAVSVIKAGGYMKVRLRKRGGATWVVAVRLD